jgi:hypothetical protein
LEAVVQPLHSLFFCPMDDHGFCEMPTERIKGAQRNNLSIQEFRS